MAKLIRKIKTFINDEDGFSIKDLVSVVILGVYVIGIIMGLISSYKGVELTRQYEYIMDQFSDVVMTVIISVMGLQAATSITDSISKRKIAKKETEVKDEDDIL